MSWVCHSERVSILQWLFEWEHDDSLSLSMNIYPITTWKSHKTWRNSAEIWKLEMEKEWWTSWPRARWEIDSQSRKYKKWCPPVMWCYVCCPVNPIAPEIYPIYFTLPRHVYEVTWSYMKLPHSSCGTALWWPRFAMSPEITHHLRGPQIRTTEFRLPNFHWSPSIF